MIYGIDRDTKTIKEATTAYDYYDCSDFLAKNKFNHTLIFEDSFCYNDASDHVPNFLSGSPLMIKDGKTYHQYGISSLGSLNREAGENVPAISPKLSIYQGWILKTVTGMFN